MDYPLCLIVTSLFLVFLGPGVTSVTYVLQTDQRLYNEAIVVVDVTSGTPIHFSCSADATDVSLEWYINDQLPSYQDSLLGVTGLPPYVVNPSLRVATLDVPPISQYNMTTVKCGNSIGSGGPYSPSMTIAMISDPPTLYVKPVQLTPHTLQFTWGGPPYDYIDYFIVTIQNGTDVLKINTTELQANATPACGVTYECSVVAVNIVGKGNALTVNYTTPPCSTLDTLSNAWTGSSAQPSMMMTSAAHRIKIEAMTIMALVVALLLGIFNSVKNSS